MARHDKPSRINKAVAPERTSQKGNQSIQAAQGDLSSADKWAALARHRKIKEQVMVDGQSSKTYLQVARKTENAAVFIAVRRAGTDYRVHFHPSLEPHSENVRELVGNINRKRHAYESKWMSYQDFITLCDLVFKDRSYAVLPTPEALHAMGVNLEGEKVIGQKNVGKWRPGDDKPIGFQGDGPHGHMTGGFNPDDNGGGPYNGNDGLPGAPFGGADESD